MNSFLTALTRKDTTTKNGALSNSSSGNSCLDYFAACGTHQGRELSAVAADMVSIFNDDPTTALKIMFYNRMVTRKSTGYEKSQKGQGQKDEFVKSLLWLESTNEDLLYKNLHLVPVVGCWKDLWYDSASTGFYHYVNVEQVYPLVEAVIREGSSTALLAKYLPKIRSNSKIKHDRHRRMNAWAKGLCRHLGWTEKQYRQFKSNPEHTAHSFQRAMCAGNWKGIDFKSIPGRALFAMLARKGRDGKNVLERRNLEKDYEKWIESQPVAKFTGYPYELYKAVGQLSGWWGVELKRNLTTAQKHTFNKQWDGLLEKARADGSTFLDRGVMCALDVSGSMSSQVTKDGTTALDVCVGLGLYFSSLLEGHFKDTVISFDSNSKIVKLTGETLTQKVQSAAKIRGGGSTNFQSVIDEIVRVRTQNPSIPVSDFPEVLLVVSDMQFNCTGSRAQTNYEVAMDKLRAVGLPDMTIIWWNVNGRYGKDVPSTMDDAGTVLISGFDGAIVSSILGAEEVIDETTGKKRKPTPLEVMNHALDQEVLNALQV